MADFIMINPASGDSSATIFADMDASSEPVGTIEKGTILKVVSSGNGFIKASYQAPDDFTTAANVPEGQENSPNGIIQASGGVPDVFKDKELTKELSKINNNQIVDILDASDDYIWYCFGYTRDGPLKFWIQSKFILRLNIETEPEPLQLTDAAGNIWGFDDDGNEILVGQIDPSELPPQEIDDE